MRRKLAAGRRNSNNDRTGPAVGGLLGRQALQSQSDAATRQAPFAEHIAGTPILEAEGGLRREPVLHVAEKQQIGLAQSKHPWPSAPSALALNRVAAAGARAIVAEAGIVFERTEVLAGGCHHRLWFQPEPCKAVLGAHAVDG